MRKKGTKRPRTYHHGDLKVTLLNVALKMLKTAPPSEISLRELARSAGVSQAAPYRHFKSKEELLIALAIEGFEIKSRYIKEAMARFPSDPLEMYYQCALSYFKMGLMHAEHFKLMFSWNITPDEKHPALMAAAVKAFGLITEMIQVCQNSKIIGRGDPFQIALNCWTVVHGFTVLYAERRLECFGLNDEISESALRSLMKQFLAGASRDHQPIKLNPIFEFNSKN